jgi:hypothetical protein
VRSYEIQQQPLAPQPGPRRLGLVLRISASGELRRCPYGQIAVQQISAKILRTGRESAARHHIADLKAEAIVSRGDPFEIFLFLQIAKKTLGASDFLGPQFLRLSRLLDFGGTGCGPSLCGLSRA